MMEKLKKHMDRHSYYSVFALVGVTVLIILSYSLLDLDFDDNLRSLDFEA